MPAPRRGNDRTVASELANQVIIRRPINSVSVQKYYNSAELVLRQVDRYRLNCDDHQLYVFLIRFASLILETIPNHKDFQRNDPGYLRLRKMLQKSYMPEVEQVRIRLSVSSPDQLPTRSRYSHQNRAPESVQMSLSALPGLDWARLTPTFGTPTGGSSMDLLSGDGLPGPVYGSYPQSSQQQQEQQQQQMLSLMPYGGAQSGASGLPAASAEALSRHALLPMPEQRRRQIHSMPHSQRPLYPSFDATPARAVDFGFSRNGSDALPSAPPLDQLVGGLNLQGGGGQGSLMDQWSAPSPAAAPPPSQQLQADLQLQMASNANPRLELALGPQEMPVDMLSAPTEPPQPGDSCCAPPPASSVVVHAPSPLEKIFDGVRDVNVSVALMEDFMRLCISNTSRNIETIGLLGGSLSPDGSSFDINTLIIPKQKGETDRVEMLAEEEIWEIFFQEGQTATQSLFPVGWIHTHPAFDCFLSSVDMHNQFGYQVMLEEAVAIVMSPRDSQNRKCGIFRLTTPGGMKLVRDCSKTGFHQHEPTETGQKVYELCGHVFINPRIGHTVVDLREK